MAHATVPSRRRARTTTAPLLLPPPLLRALVLSVLLVAVAACSSGDGGPGDAAEASGSEATAGTEETEPAATPDPSEAAARPSAGCRSGVPAAPGSRRVELRGEGARWYLLDVPAVAAESTDPLPVVISLHAEAEGADLHRDVTGLYQLGDREGFVTLTPAGRGDGRPKQPFWDARSGSPDVEFVLEVLDRTAGELCIDEARVYVTGFSGGAFLASTLACDAADRVAAIAPVAGVRDPVDCEPSRPVPVLAFHGTDDTYIGFDGGLGEGTDTVGLLPGIEGGDGRTALGRYMPGALYDSVPQIVDAWAARNGCDGQDEAEEVAGDVERFGFDCPAGAEVGLYRIEAGHSWPGSEISADLRDVLGRTTMSIDASALIWEFFAANAITD